MERPRKGFQIPSNIILRIKQIYNLKKMKYINCILCGSGDYKVIFKNKADNFIKLDNEANVISQKVICKICGLIFQNPTFTEEEMKNIYSSRYGINVGYGDIAPTAKFLKEKKFRAEEQLKWLETLIGPVNNRDGIANGRRALEIGSSAGLFLNLLQNKGWEVEGIEPAKHFADYAKITYGIKIYPNFLEEVELEKSSYDLIILSHVLEHMPDPILILSKLGAYLKPDGLLFLEVPNIKGIWKNLDDQFQSSHLFIPSVNTLKRIAARAGLRIFKMETKNRIIRCLLSTSEKNSSADANIRLVLKSDIKSDNYRALSLRLRLQRLTSCLFKRFSFITALRSSSISDTVVFTLSNYISTAFSFISSFIIRKILGPLTMGLYTELMLIFEYGKFHQLGMINALEREVPFYIGKNDARRVEEIKKTTFAFITFSALNVAAILFIVSFFGGVHKIGLRLVAFLILIETIISFYEALLQSYHRFKLWSLFIIVIGFLDVFLKVILVVKFGLNGLLGAMALIGIVTIAIYNFWGKCRVDFHVKAYLKEALRLLKLGVPLIIFRVMYLLSTSIDRLAIIFFLGRLQLGYYSVATMVSNYLTLMPKFSYKTLYPKFLEAFGKNEDIEDVKKYLIAPNRVFACLFSILIGFAVITIPFFVAYLLPRFKNGIFAAQIIAFAAFFSAHIYTWNYLLIALYQQKRLAFLYGVSAIITFIINLFFINVLHMQITGVALATLISQFIFTTILICYGYRYYTRDVFEHMKLLYSLYLPSILIVVALLGAKLYYPRLTSLKEDLFAVAVSCATFLIFCVPIVYYMNKKERLLYRIFKRKETTDV